MATESSKEILAEANSAVETIPVERAISMVGDPNVVFDDVREGAEREKGTVKGSVHASRSFLEFRSRRSGQHYAQAGTCERKLVLFCGSGGRSALGTLKEMGVENVAHIRFGFGAWQKANGPTKLNRLAPQPQTRALIAQFYSSAGGYRMRMDLAARMTVLAFA
jgi:rhodanese-related sulfurtransferase